MTTLSKYELHEQLGKGGFGTVYRATDNIGRTVAVKVLKPGLADDPEVLERFRREALAAGTLFHSHIATILDFDEAEGRVFLVMRYIDGKPLNQVLKERGKLPLEEALEVTGQIADALQFAHKKGFIHRDIKPGNILISPTEGAVLTDFGLVKAVNVSGMSTTAVMLGTPAYIAPEVWEGKEVSPATDVYSLACVFYEMVTGKVLFEGESTPDVMTKHMLKGPQLEESLAEPIRGVLIRALAKDPMNRYQSMDEFAAALKKLGREAPVPGAGSLPEGINSPVTQGERGTVETASPPTSSQPEEPPVSPKVWPVVAGVFVIVGALVVAVGAASNWSSQPATPVATAAAATEAPSSLGIGSTQVSSKDGMTLDYVPAGDFLMGSPGGVGDDDEHPQHTVYLDGYWIDQTLVTNGMYAKCVSAGACTAPADKYSNTCSSYYGNSTYDDYPVIYVDWNQANTYCQWAGRALPTEAQWEKAARGTEGRTYPWGNQAPDKMLANYSSSDTSQVGSYPAGASPYGTLDMAGNVWEWVADWYGSYPSGTVSNPTGPASGTGRVLRGGSWYGVELNVRSAFRSWLDPSFTSNYDGFRCSLSQN